MTAHDRSGKFRWSTGRLIASWDSFISNVKRGYDLAYVCNNNRPHLPSQTLANMQLRSPVVMIFKDSDHPLAIIKSNFSNLAFISKERFPSRERLHSLNSLSETLGSAYR